MPVRLKRIHFIAGSSSDRDPLSMEPDTVTVIVGPNNSGKSASLVDLDSCLRAERANWDPRVVRDIELEIPPPQDREAELQAIGGRYVTKEQFNVPHAYPGGSTTLGGIVQLQRERSALDIFGKAFTLRLDGTSRLNLIASGAAADLLQSPKNHLMRLFQDRAARHELGALAFEAFNKYFVVDATGMSEFRARLSDRMPIDDDEEQGLTPRAREFHSKARLLSEYSDGVRCYLSAIAAILSPQTQILLIDEPEAFLHPPLARNLGLHLARIAKRKNSQIITATHSADFLMGLLDSGAQVNVVRLTYSGASGTATLLPRDTIDRFNRDPLLRSSSVLDALFYDHVIITEGDADRAFYEEINRRLLENDAAEGIASCLFLNAQGKDAIPKLLDPLRNLGLRVAAIADIDVFLDGGRNWSNQLHAAGVPEATAAGWSTSRSRLADAVRERHSDAQQSRKVFKQSGLQIFDGELQDAARDLVAGLARYGYFVVDVGELEGWLRGESITGHGPSWLIPMFERMGFDTANPSYMRPMPTDVWDFVRRIALWLRARRSS